MWPVDACCKRKTRINAIIFDISGKRMLASYGTWRENNGNNEIRRNF